MGTKYSDSTVIGKMINIDGNNRIFRYFSTALASQSEPLWRLINRQSGKEHLGF